MPTVDDAARKPVWRPCSGCGLLSPLPPTTDRCPACHRQYRPTVEMAGWDRARRYAAALGSIEAWAVLIPGASDAERLDRIRLALETLNQEAA